MGHARKKRTWRIATAIVAFLGLAGVAYAAYWIDFESPRVSNVACRWSDSGGIVSTGELTNPSPVSRTFAVFPHFEVAGIGTLPSSVHTYLSVAAHATRPWVVMVAFPAQRNKPITGCSVEAYGADKPAD